MCDLLQGVSVLAADTFIIDKLEEYDVFLEVHKEWGLDYFYERVHLLTFKGA